MQSAVDFAVSRNVTVYAAAGNERHRWAAENFPANCRGVVSVGALTSGMRRAYYSSPFADVYMPGGDWGEEVPCLKANLSRIGKCVGTSFAVPHAAGLTALTGCVPLKPQFGTGPLLLWRRHCFLNRSIESSLVWGRFGGASIDGGYQQPMRMKRLFGGSTAGHTCAEDEDGRIRCWGYGHTGQLGTGSTDDWGWDDFHMGRYMKHVAMLGGRDTRVSGLSTGSFITCAVLGTGRVVCWGGSYLHSILGYGAVPLMLLEPPASDWINLGNDDGDEGVDVACGYRHTCVILAGSRQVKCWGLNNYAGLGYEDRRPVLSPADVHPVDIAPNTTVRQISTGSFFTCALVHESSRVKCWGDNRAGQLGIGTDREAWGELEGEMGDGLPYVDIGMDLTVKEVHTADYHACVIVAENDGVKCWGVNWAGNLGTGNHSAWSIGSMQEDMGDALQYVKFGTVEPRVRALSLGGAHSCALMMHDSSVRCWGDNWRGQLGYGSSVVEFSATAEKAVVFGGLHAQGLVRVEQIVAKFDHTCALMSNGDVHCWGGNTWGQLGLGHDVDVYSPAWVPKLDLGYMFCGACPTGTRAVPAGRDDEGCSHRCEACPMGFFSDALHSPDCLRCPARTYTDAEGSSACKACGAGTFTARTDETCRPCPPGTYSNDTSGLARVCPPCEEGSFAARHGAASCTLCALGTATQQFEKL